MHYVRPVQRHMQQEKQHEQEFQSAFVGGRRCRARSVDPSDSGFGAVLPGSVYGPYYNPHTMNNGTGTVPDSERDPHNDR